MKLKDGKIEIHITDIIDSLTLEEKQEVAKNLVWSQDIFDEMIDQLATGKIVTSSFYYNVYNARLKLMELFPEMNRNIIRSLLYELKEARDKVRRWDRWAWELFHKWPRGYEQERPKTADFVATEWPTEAEVDSVIQGVQQS